MLPQGLWRRAAPLDLSGARDGSCDRSGASMSLLRRILGRFRRL